MLMISSFSRWPGRHDVKGASRADEISRVLRDQKFRAAVDRRLRRPIICRIGGLRSPPKMRLPRLAERGEFGKRDNNLHSGQTVFGALVSRGRSFPDLSRRYLRSLT